MSLTVDSSNWASGPAMHAISMSSYFSLFFFIQANKSMIINYYKHGIGLHHLGDGTCVYMHEVLKWFCDLDFPYNVWCVSVGLFLCRLHVTLSSHLMQSWKRGCLFL